MKQIFSLALAAGVALAAAAPASAQSVVAPQEAQAPVPATQYRSAFDGYRPVAEDDATPDQTWRALNQKVGDAGGHMGMMKLDGHTMPGHKMEGHKMEGQKREGQKRDAHAMPMDKMPTQHAMPQPDAKPAGQPAPQHHHEGH